MKTQQVEKELDIFREFAEICPLKILSDSIARLKPPAPDISCTLETGHRIGFELTELVDQKFMSRFGSSMKLKKYFSWLCQTGLEPEDRRKLQARFGNTIIRVDFCSRTTENRRKTAARDLLLALLDLSADSKGSVLVRDPRFCGVVKSVLLHRGKIVGPMFQIDQFGWLGDPTETVIAKKLAKNYTFEHRIDLLAYFQWDQLPPEKDWKVAIENVVQKFNVSPFQRIWVFDLAGRKIPYVRAG